MQDKGGALSFERDIRPLFRDVDIDHMEAFGVQLADHSWMSDPENAKLVYESLSSEAQSRMPPGGPYWSDEQLKTLSDWMHGGCQP